MKVLLEGPLLTQSGYGEHARLIYRALKSQPNLQVFVLPNNWGRTSWIISEDEEMKTIEADIRAYSTINKEQTTMDIHVHVGILNEFEKREPSVLRQKQLVIYLNELDRRRNTDWKKVYPQIWNEVKDL